MYRWLAIFLVTCFGCAEQQPASYNKASIERFEAIKKGIMTSAYPYNNRLNAEREYRLLAGINPVVVLERRYKYFEELLYAGETESCIEAMEEHLQLAFPDGQINRANQKYYRLLALAYLRQGEVQNCIANHSPYSCIVPLQEGGIHQIQEPARQSLALYKKLLQYDPYDHEAAWLIHIAAMALGEFPSEDEFLALDQTNFDSGREIPYFHDIAGYMGVDVRGRAGGSSLEDFNNDGYLDIFCSSYGLNDQCRLFLSDGKGGYEDVTNEFGLTGITKGLNFIHGDYDNDGWVDILILRGAWLRQYGAMPNALLRNVEGKYFQDVTEEAGLLAYLPTQTAAFGDVNLDGYLDLFIGNEYHGEMPAPSELYINKGDGTFVLDNKNYGIDVQRYVKGVIMDDFDNNRYPDIYVSVDGNDNILLMNLADSITGKRVFIDRAQQAGVTAPRASFPVMAMDINNDGNQDLMVSSYDNPSSEAMLQSTLDYYLGNKSSYESFAVYLNNGDGTFASVADAMAMDYNFLTMGCNFGDINNDGWQDVYLGTGEFSLPISVPNLFFLNEEGTSFEDVTTSGGFGQIQKGHGVSFGDMDRDGDQDIYHTVGGALEGDIYQNMMLENPGSAHRSVTLVLKGHTANHFAVGAKVRLVFRENNSTRETWYTVGTGGSFGNNSLQIEAGLGSSTTVDSIIVAWPHISMHSDTLFDLRAGKVYQIEESQGYKELLRPPFSLKKTRTHRH